MKLSLDKIESLCKRQNTRIGEILEDAGVSRNAFYTLARKETVIPRSVMRIAESLGVPASALLDDIGTPAERMRSLLAETNRIARRHRSVDRDNVRHTLLLLDEKPLDRLRRALLRGRPVNLR